MRKLMVSVLCIWISLWHRGAWSLPAEKLQFQNFQHRAVLDQENKYHLLWTPRENDVIFEVQVQTPGYVGLGFSPNGGMKGADIVIGWVDDQGQLHLEDRHAVGFTTPIIDDSHDIEVLGGFQNNSHTIFRFRRPWSSCDNEHDFSLTEDTVRVIWAYNDADPEVNGTMSIHSNRGTKSIYLKEPHFRRPDIWNKAKTWEIRAPEIEVPGDLDTLYWCQIIKMPNVTRKHQIIGLVPVIEKKNLQHIHHIIMHECHMQHSELHLEKWIDIKGHQCSSPNMPNSWSYCNFVIIAWAIGSDGEIYPEHTGLPMGEEYGGATYYLLEMHYDNPKLHKGIVDTSGLDIYYTDNLRPNDLGLITMGHEVTPLQTIPPGQNWETTGHCSGDCTRKEFPKGGIKVISALLHAHTLGSGIRVRHIREGVEIPTNIQDMNYDFNYQQQRIFRNEISVLPGDSFITECYYESKGKRGPIFGGIGTNEEMCLVFLLYYPRVGLSKCVSMPLLSSFYNTFGIRQIYDEEATIASFIDNNNLKNVNIEDEKTQLLNLIEGKEVVKLESILASDLLKSVKALGPQELFNLTLYDIMQDESTWENQKLLRTLLYETNYGPHYAFCTNPEKNDKKINGVEVPVVYNYPDFLATYRMNQKCTANN